MCYMDLVYLSVCFQMYTACLRLIQVIVTAAPANRLLGLDRGVDTLVGME